MKSKVFQRSCLTFTLALAAANAPASAQTYPATEWGRFPAPESAGWNSAQLREAFAWGAEKGSAAILIVQDGRIVASHGDLARKYNAHSMRKSMLSLLYGRAIESGQVRLDQTLADLAVDDVAPALTPDEKKATLADLLTARSGVYHAAAYETPGMANNRPVRGSHTPGTFFFYNNWDFNALGTIYETRTGRGIFDAFRDEIAAPLGLQDFVVGDGVYVKEDVSDHRAYTMRLSTRDLARIGWMALNAGKWRERQIVSANWIAESTRPHVNIGILGGYGYMWWAARDGEHLPFVKFPDGTFSARGTGEQNVLVIPAWKLVIVHRTDTDRPPPYMRVTDFGRLVQRILAARLN